MRNEPSAARLIHWFDPRSRHPGYWAFILNRVTALGLTLYLAMHLVMLGKLAQGAEAYDSFVKLAKTPVVMVGEILVIMAGLIHGMNGLRIALTSFGIGVRHQKLIFWIIMALSILGTAFFAWKMVSGE